MCRTLYTAYVTSYWRKLVFLCVLIARPFCLTFYVHHMNQESLQESSMITLFLITCCIILHLTIEIPFDWNTSNTFYLYSLLFSRKPTVLVNTATCFSYSFILLIISKNRYYQTNFTLLSILFYYFPPCGSMHIRLLQLIMRMYF